MSDIAKRLDDDLKTAMRAKDQAKVACVRQLRSKAQEAMNAADFKGPADDAFYQKTINGYVRMLEKGIADLGGAGDRGTALITSYRNEIDYLSQFLPKMLSPDVTATLVKDTIAALGAKEAKDVGRVIGAIMKEHKGQVDPALTRKLVEEALKV
ncbi:MAG: GatB/YqeY domain-containing protein [Myxococcota bacterium]|nr:GatB/YqeY domain-containing protein [Myxococcota bacterium]